MWIINKLILLVFLCTNYLRDSPRLHIRPCRTLDSSQPPFLFLPGPSVMSSRTKEDLIQRSSRLLLCPGPPAMHWRSSITACVSSNFAPYIRSESYRNSRTFQVVMVHTLFSSVNFIVLRLVDKMERVFAIKDTVWSTTEIFYNHTYNCVLYNGNQVS